METCTVAVLPFILKLGFLTMPGFKANVPVLPSSPPSPPVCLFLYQHILATGQLHCLGVTIQALFFSPCLSFIPGPPCVLKRPQYIGRRFPRNSRVHHFLQTPPLYPQGEFLCCWRNQCGPKGSVTPGVSFLATLQGNKLPLWREWSRNTRTRLEDWKTKKSLRKLEQKLLVESRVSNSD